MLGSGPLRALCSVSAVLLMAAGDPGRGREVVMRQTSTCLLCHAGPFPNPHLQGTVGPDLHGVGGRLTEGEIRERLVDAGRLNPDTVMPAFGGVGVGARVGAAWRGKPILDAQEIDDVVAFLVTLK